MPFEIVRNDITKMEVDAIVNAANTALRMGGGVCGAIFDAAGAEELQKECDAIGGCETGQAVITKGYRLPAKYIIHTAGPVWRGGKSGEADLLRDCYANSLALAEKYDCGSVAFPLISSGIYGYPKDEALSVATAAIGEFLAKSDMSVSLVVFDKNAFSLAEETLGSIRSFIDRHYVTVRASKRRPLLDVERSALAEAPVMSSRKMSSRMMSAPSAKSLDDLVEDLDEPFSRTLLRLIDATGKTDVEVYRRANIDRKLFSKIRNNAAYTPSKKTAVAFAVALELGLDETQDLLERAGYSLSRSQKFDVIIEYFITNENYDIFEINEALFYFDQPLLGA
ncbi:MAG: macro domain-containing protein [Synergistaceae bacterium]|jgi:O-acetyl-ADP-ribose deacetylase (regulator of RNase III)|nr:macro domain-containing protein [Synergistaceae bacterium]